MDPTIFVEVFACSDGSNVGGWAVCEQTKLLTPIPSYAVATFLPVVEPHSGSYSGVCSSDYGVDRVVRRAHDDAANTATLFVALAWMVAFAVVGYHKTNFSCPRCGEMFFRAWDDRPWRKTWRSNAFARSCRHCGLPKWSTGDDA